MGKHLPGGAAEEILLGALAATFHQGLVDQPVSSLRILDEEHDVGDPVKKALDEAGSLDPGLEQVVFIHAIVPNLKFDLRNHTR